MPLQVHTSTSLERLYDAIAARPRPRDPFQPECVVVQSRKAAAPLLAAVALRRGVAAHIETPTSAAFFEALAAAAGMEQSEAAGGWDFARGGLTAALCDAVLAHRDDPRFSSFAWEQLAPTATRTVTGKLFALARQLSASFGRYARHDPSLLEAWTDGAEPDDWQATLWRAVAPAMTAVLPHQRWARLAESIQAGGLLPKTLPSGVAIVGHRALDPLQLQILSALATRIEVELFVLTASAPHASLGAFVRRFDRAGGEVLRALQPIAIPVSHPAGRRASTVLGALQDRLEGLETSAESTHDESLQFHGCRGAVAQVDRVRDLILTALNDDPTLEPRDIQIATPHMALFAPLIETIFAEALPPRVSGGAAPPPILPRLVDVPEERRNPLAAALGAAFDLADSRLNLQDVSMFLARPLIMGALELDDDTLGRCHKLFDAAAIRWGRDEHHRRAFGQPAVRVNTWRHGFDRILLGYAFADDTGASRGTFDDFAPVPGVEGSDVPEFGRCIDFLIRLFGLFEEMATPVPIEAWRDRIFRMTRLLAGGHRDAPTLLQDTWAMLGELDQGLGVAFDLDAVRLQLQILLRASRPLPSFQAGGVVVTDLGPERASPRRRVYLVGLDEGTLGGERATAAFDRMASLHEDHAFDPGEDARLGFFEFILSTRESLCITWDRGSTPTQSDAQPAAAVQELRRALQGLVQRDGSDCAPETAAAPPARETWEAKDLPAAGSRPPTVSWPDAMPIPQAPGATRASHVRLQDLTALLVAPHKTLMTGVLGVKLLTPDRALATREPIEPNRLEKYFLAERLPSLYLKGVPPAHARRLYRAEGHLPYGNAGEIVFDDLHEKALAVASGLADLVEERTTARETRFPLPLTHARIDFTVDGTAISGVLDGLVVETGAETNPNAGPLRLIWRSGRLRAQDEVRLWVEHLALTLSGVRAPTSVFVARSPDRGARLGVYTLPRLPRALAAREMTALVALHHRHLEGVTHFYPDTGRGFAAAVDRAASGHGTPDLRAANSEWFRLRAFGGDEPGGDQLEPHGAYMTGALRESDYPFSDADFRETSLRLFAPIAAWLHHGRR